MKPLIVIRRGLAAAVVIAAALLVSCSPDLLLSDSTQARAAGSADAKSGDQGPEGAYNFRAHLKGDAEVPPRTTQAQGQAIFHLSKDGTELSYKIIASNIENILQGHIHLAPEGANGSVIAWLYPSAPPAQLIPGRSNGVLAEGTITAASLVGPLAGQPLSALIDAMRAGGTYANVHTSQFTGGEIRGQIH